MIGGEYTGNHNMLDYLCEQSQKSVEKYYKKLNDDLVKEIQTEKSKVTVLEHDIDELKMQNKHYAENFNKVLQENHDLKKEIRELEGELYGR